MENSRLVTGKFYKTIVLNKIKEQPQISPLENDFCMINASTHKTRIVTKFLESEVTLLPHSQYSLNSNIIYLKRDAIWEMPVDLLLISIWILIEESELCFKSGSSGSKGVFRQIESILKGKAR